MKKIKRIFEEIFETSVINKDFKELKLNDIEQWDSIGNLNLLLAIEQKFDVKFTTKEIEDFSSIKKIYELLKSRNKI